HLSDSFASSPVRLPLFPYTTLFRSSLCNRTPDSHFKKRGSAGYSKWVLTASGIQAKYGLPRPTLTHPLPGRILLGPTGCRSQRRDRKSTRLNSSHVSISYAVFCLKT